MIFRSLRRSLAGVALASVASLLLISCGGGGAAGSAETAAKLTVLPATGTTLYAGVPAEFQVLGGKMPYVLSSSEPNLVPVPNPLNGHGFSVIPINPGVIDAGLPPTALPVRTVNITAVSGDGQSATTSVKVAQNFMIGYGISFSPVSCATTGTGSASATSSGACAGGETLVRLTAVVNGNLYAGRQYRFEVLRGQFQFVFPQTGVVGNTLTVTTDAAGEASALIAVAAGTPTQIAVMRVTDVATGLYYDQVFVISGVGANGKLTVLPAAITFTGNLTTECGAGAGTFLVFDGVPPFTAISSNPNINVDSTSSSNPGQFTVRISSTVPPCQTGTIIVTDSVGNRATVDVSSVQGTATPPPPPLQVSPSSITLECGASGSVSVVGGSSSGTTTSYSVSSPTSFITTVVSGNTITVTRLNTGTTPATSTTLTVTDGATIVGLNVNTTKGGVPTTTCP